MTKSRETLRKTATDNGWTIIDEGAIHDDDSYWEASRPATDSQVELLFATFTPTGEWMGAVVIANGVSRELMRMRDARAFLTR